MPFYAVLAVALGTVDPVLFQAVPIWNPLEWNVGWIQEVSTGWPGRDLTDVRTLAYVASRRALPAHRLPRRLLHRPARRATKGLLLILLIAPLWINYLMRMLAWVNLLAPDGYVNRFLTFTHVPRAATGSEETPRP